MHTYTAFVHTQHIHKHLPPVTNTGIPALCARTMVADTVVAPLSFFAMTSAKSRRDVLRTLGSLATLVHERNERGQCVKEGRGCAGEMYEE